MIFSIKPLGPPTRILMSPGPASNVSTTNLPHAFWYRLSSKPGPCTLTKPAGDTRNRNGLPESVSLVTTKCNYLVLNLKTTRTWHFYVIVLHVQVVHSDFSRFQQQQESSVCLLFQLTNRLRLDSLAKHLQFACNRQDIGKITSTLDRREPLLNLTWPRTARVDVGTNRVVDVAEQQSISCADHLACIRWRHVVTCNISDFLRLLVLSKRHKYKHKTKQGSIQKMTISTKNPGASKILCTYVIIRTVKWELKTEYLLEVFVNDGACPKNNRIYTRVSGSTSRMHVSIAAG